jgi:crotonobetainyl-CoA:carnitine CoA-transferase CaiB-like acyl-CoA transferase
VTTPAALSGIRVLEMGIGVNTPYAGTILAEYGAEVIRIEPPGADGGRSTVTWAGVPQLLGENRSAIYEHTNTNKKGITLNLKHPRAKELFYMLARQSDVVLTAYRTRTARALGIDYETLAGLNPRLIYGVSSAYGQEGPDAGVPGYDYTGLARSGLMFTMGEPDMPPLVTSAVMADTMGATLLAVGVLTALEAREQSGVGQRVDTSLLMAGIHLLRFDIYTALNMGAPYERFDRARVFNPLWNYYRCADDRWVMLAMPFPDQFWGQVCDLLGLPELAADPRYATFEQREHEAAALVPAFDAAFLKKPRAEWLALFREADLAYAPVARITDLPDDPQVMANGYLTEFDHPELGRQLVPGSPVRLSETPATLHAPAPLVGEHTDELLTRLCGCSADELERLRREGAL